MTPDDVEIWRSIPSLDGVFASSHGRIWRSSYSKEMPNGGLRVYSSKPTFGVLARSSSDARHLYFAYRYAEHGNIKVHAAVCEAFHGLRPSPRHGVRHKNENSLDNRPENIEWSTQRVNMNDDRFVKYHVDVSGRKSMSKIDKRRDIYASILDVAETVFARRSA